MLPNSSFRKLVQISEDALPLVHVPLILGKDFFILTQQDVRKIEDTRLFSICKVMPNGDLKHVNDQDASVWLQQLEREEHCLSNQNVRSLLEFLMSKSNGYREYQQQAMLKTQQENSLTYGATCSEPMETSTTDCETCNVASIEQQLQWNKCENTSAPFPIKYSQGTSTTEINYKQEIKNQRSCYGSCKILCNKSTNTPELSIDFNKNEILGAREQLKRKKLSYSFI